MSDLKLQVSKFYRTRDERKVECIFLLTEEFTANKGYSAIVRYEDGNISALTENGSFFSSERKHSGDIVSEWQETTEGVAKRISFDLIGVLKKIIKQIQ